MPLSEYFHGGGEKVMKNMVGQYGADRGKQIFYATANARHAKPMQYGGLAGNEYQGLPELDEEGNPIPNTHVRPGARFDVPLPPPPPQLQRPPMRRPEMGQETPPELSQPDMESIPAPPDPRNMMQPVPPQPQMAPPPSVTKPPAGPSEANPGLMDDEPGPPQRPFQTGQTDKLISQAQGVMQEKPKWWQNALGAALAFSPKTRGIDVHPNITRNRQNLALQQTLADEERKQEQAKALARYHDEGAATQGEYRRRLIEQRRDAQKKPPTVDELGAMKHPDGTPVFNKEQIAIILGGGKLASPKVSAPVMHNVAPGNVVLGQDGKPIYTAPSKEEKVPEDVNHWIATVKDPNSSVVDKSFAQSKIDEWEKTQKNQRQPIVNVNAVPSDPAIDQAAVRYLKSGELPAFGMGRDAATTRAKVLNRAAELDPEADIATNKGTYGADKTSLAALQKTSDSINAFEGLARKNLDRFIAVSKRTIDTGQPWANRVFRGGARVLGDKNAAEFEAARTTAFTEVAKVLNNPTSSSVLSDSARGEADKVINGSYTIPQLVAVSELLKSEMGTRKEENNRALGEIRKRMGGSSSKKDPLGIR